MFESIAKWYFRRNPQVIKNIAVDFIRENPKEARDLFLDIIQNNPEFVQNMLVELFARDTTSLPSLMRAALFGVTERSRRHYPGLFPANWVASVHKQASVDLENLEFFQDFGFFPSEDLLS